MNMIKPPPAPSMTVTVGLDGRSYDILIGRGLLCSSASRIAHLNPGGSVAIVTDETVAGIHAQTFETCLEAAGLRTTRIVIPAGEGSKSYAQFQAVCEAILAARIERGDLVVALGGGVVGDLTGFAAASVRRGVPFVQVPTTLLAQVDSSVGGKTGINSPHGKNLIGAFHQPSLVVADTGILDTLPRREFQAGYAEIIKYGVIEDEPFFTWCEANWEGIFKGTMARDEAVAKSCRAKAAIVERDEREDGDRALLNLGHTFAHALERLTDYDSKRLIHGEAVAIGLAMALRFSSYLGLCAPLDAERLETHLRQVGLPISVDAIPGASFTAEAMLEVMAQDKKVRRGALTFILAHGIGRSFVARDVEREKVREFLVQSC